MSERQSYKYITRDDQLAEYCENLRSCDLIAFDTEFVAEDSYWPDLCLIQVASNDEYAILDPTEGMDANLFWNTLNSGSHVTVAHAAREEFLFCWRQTQARPSQLFDIQLAAGFVGYEYPASYGNLVNKLLGERVDKGETRTDWRRRPLSKRQINYAVQDVVFLEAMANIISEDLEQRKRRAWFEEEMDLYQRRLETFDSSDRWRRVSGIAGLRPRELAIVRAVWSWREGEAKRRDIPARRVLRDDLIMELAKRGSSNEKEISSLRGMNHRQVQKQIDRIAAAIAEANELPKGELPKSGKPQSTPNLGILGQILSVALSAICRKANIAPALVGTSQDVREWAAWKLELFEPKSTPSLATGWRAEIIGKQLEAILKGKASLRVDNPLAEIPLSIDEG